MKLKHAVAHDDDVAVFEFYRASGAYECRLLGATVFEIPVVAVADDDSLLF